MHLHALARGLMLFILNGWGRGGGMLHLPSKISQNRTIGKYVWNGYNKLKGSYYPNYKIIQPGNHKPAPGPVLQSYCAVCPLTLAVMRFSGFIIICIQFLLLFGIITFTFLHHPPQAYIKTQPSAPTHNPGLAL